MASSCALIRTLGSAAAVAAAAVALGCDDGRDGWRPDAAPDSGPPGADAGPPGTDASPPSLPPAVPAPFAPESVPARATEPCPLADGAPCAGGCGTIACSGATASCVPAPPPADCTLFESAGTLSTPVAIPLPLFGWGVAIGDVDGDADADVVAGGVVAHLMMNDGAGAFAEDAAAFAGGAPAMVAGVALADWDGDGDLDLSLTRDALADNVRLWANDGAGVFTDVSAGAGLPDLPLPSAFAWADMDGDGWLDAFVSGWNGSALLRNLGDGTFSDLAPALGMDRPDLFTYQGAWFDYDDDGDQDLFVANDKGPVTGVACQLYRNDGASAFTDVTTTAGLGDAPIDAMGLGVGDFDDDGDLDVVVTNVPGVPTAGVGQLLYLNAGDGTFVESAAAAGVTLLDRYGWGVAWADFDLDGDLDLALASVIGSGYAGPWLGERAGDGLLDVTAIGGVVPPLSTFGLASGDFDADGRPDLAWGTFSAYTGLELARNAVATTAAGHYLRVRLVAPPPNVHAVGAVVHVEAGGVRRMRHLAAGGSYRSSSEPVLHFGLGAASTIDLVEVEWPDGATTAIPGPLPADQSIDVVW